jgi:exodeoxyribonuclease V beta subunit
MLERLRRLPLNAENSNLTLARTPSGERRTEMEFHFPTGGLDAARLLNLIRSPKPGPSASPRAAVTQVPLQGFLKGFIDLVFRIEGRYHIVDWKSNLLGNRA